jgi:hypothetical protein
MNDPKLRQQLPLEHSLHHEKKRGRRKDEVPDRSSLKFPVPSGTPFFCGNCFVRSYGGPSHERLETHSGCGCSSASGSGCFGISRGGGGGGSSGATTTNSAVNDASSGPPLNEKYEDPETLIARAINQLSLQDRELAYEDLHGVAAGINETPAFIEESLQKMEQSLQGVRHKPAYDAALTMQADYVHDPKLLLMFLRADRFDAEKAAKRFTLWLDWKSKLFGQERLCQRHIGLDDLDDDARWTVKSGFFQMLPERDSRGRLIISVASNYRCRVHRSTQSFLQMAFYSAMRFAEDEANQKSGVVIVCYCLGPTAKEFDDRHTTWEVSKLTLCTPTRLEAIHYCTSTSGMQYVWDLVKGFGVFNRARIRIHFGTHMECQYALLCFGLPSHLLPFTSEGELKTCEHKSWVQRTVMKDHEVKRGATFSGLELPRRNDVLLGQGKPLQAHPGNQRFRELVELYLDEYDKASRVRNGDSKIVIRKFLYEIQCPSSNSGGAPNGVTYHCEGARFLRRRDDNLKSGWWIEVTDEKVLIEKVASAFRTFRKRISQVDKTGSVKKKV